MKREIKFRGKRLDNGEWMYGSLVIINGRTFIFNDDMRKEVDPKTVGQYTGWKDKNGGEIYEGDIVGGSNGSINCQEWPFQLEVRWDEEKCRFTVPQWRDMYRTHYYNVLGNIHDNPELLKSNEKKLTP